MSKKIHLLRRLRTSQWIRLPGLAYPRTAKDGQLLAAAVNSWLQWRDLTEDEKRLTLGCASWLDRNKE